MALWVPSGLGEGGPLRGLPVCRRDGGSGGVLLQRVRRCLLWEDLKGEQTERLGPQHPARSVFKDQSIHSSQSWTITAVLTYEVEFNTLKRNFEVSFGSILLHPPRNNVERSCWKQIEKGSASLFLRRACVCVRVCVSFLPCAESQLGFLPPICFC